jgi:NAD(P)-dependent dehydrogenase (short-subunit alcohol dehydrogenase family)
MLKEFEGGAAVITGAGSGFGREFARIGATRGMKLVLADVQADALEQTGAMVSALGCQDLVSEVADVSDPDAMNALAERCHDTFGAASLLFNNAGVAAGGLIWETAPADWSWVLGVNLVGVANGISAFVPEMIRAGRPAHVVNTASVAGLLSPPNLGVYNVSKHGVVALSETLYHDLNLVKSSVGVSVLCPAFVPTGIAESERNRPDRFELQAAPSESARAAMQVVQKAVRRRSQKRPLRRSKLTSSTLSRTTTSCRPSERVLKMWPSYETQLTPMPEKLLSRLAADS